MYDCVCKMDNDIPRPEPDSDSLLVGNWCIRPCVLCLSSLSHHTADGAMLITHLAVAILSKSYSDLIFNLK